MRSRDPRILTYVKKSVFSSLLVILIFTSVFLLYYQVLEIIATIHVRIYFHQISFEKNCVPDDPSEWGPYCKRLVKPLQENDRWSLYLKHFIIMIIVATQVSWICSELLIELGDRSKEFRRCRRNDYQLNVHRQNSRGS